MQPAGQDPEARLVPGTVQLPLCSQTNASPFWIMLLLVWGRVDNGMIQFWQLGRAGLGEPGAATTTLSAKKRDEPHASGLRRVLSPAAIARRGCILLRRIVGPGSKQPLPFDAHDNRNQWRRYEQTRA
jgi:hypothetical protein